jgi:hypothetical protein
VFSVVEPFWKTTVPVGTEAYFAVGVTVAVSVTACPAATGEGDAANVIVAVPCAANFRT